MRGRERVRGAQLHGDLPDSEEEEKSKEVPDVSEEADGEGEGDGGGEVIAVLCSDIHLRHTCPVSRAEKDNWYEVQAGYLKQLGDLANKHEVPIVCAGDIFHKWNSCPELINFAMVKLPKMYAVPGQHDLPFHNYDDIKKSAYWSMVQSGRVIDIKANEPLKISDNLTLHPFPYGFVPIQPNNKKGKGVQLAVIHRYIWMEGKGYPGAPEETRLSNTLPQLKGYDVAVFGDNHSGFFKGKVLNCGGFMRQKSDEKDYKPMVGLLMNDGSINVHYLDVKKDKWEDKVVDALTKDPNTLQHFEELVELLQESGEVVLDFGAILHRHIRKLKVSPDVREVILKSLEGK